MNRVSVSRSLDGAGLFVLVLLQQQTQVIVSDLDLIGKALVLHLQAQTLFMSSMSV